MADETDKAPARKADAPTGASPDAPSSTAASGNTDQDLSGYIGVDPMYQNYANETERPLVAAEGPEQVIEELAVKHQEALDAQATETPSRLDYDPEKSAADRAANEEAVENQRASSEQ